MRSDNLSLLGFLMYSMVVCDVFHGTFLQILLPVQIISFREILTLLVAPRH